MRCGMSPAAGARAARCPAARVAVCMPVARAAGAAGARARTSLLHASLRPSSSAAALLWPSSSAATSLCVAASSCTSADASTFHASCAGSGAPGGGAPAAAAAAPAGGAAGADCTTGMAVGAGCGGRVWRRRRSWCGAARQIGQTGSNPAVPRAVRPLAASNSVSTSASPRPGRRDRCAAADERDLLPRGPTLWGSLSEGGTEMILGC
jgi:hypothetical protein